MQCLLFLSPLFLTSHLLTYYRYYVLQNTLATASRQRGVASRTYAGTRRAYLLTSYLFTAVEGPYTWLHMCLGLI
ncbi:hypothetical protein GGR56DRAFT_622529 [Xylariaceae sp. FL0804]|nr:hypothetical protein GGR56DRAFT_622529 [Xylariaceae sp. FL0804]